MKTDTTINTFFVYISVVAVSLVCAIALVVFIGTERNFISFLHPMFRLYNIKQHPSPLSHDRVQHIVCMVASGRMGNTMFEFASTYGIARSKGMKLLVPENFYLLKIFKLKVDVYKINSTICDPSRVVTRSERQACAFDKNLVNFDNTSDVRIALYLQSYLYFDKFNKELRQQFIFKDEIQKEANKLIENILKENHITTRTNVRLIGVHVRRGDYVNHPAGYKVATKQYLEKAVLWYQSRYKNIYFIVASNGLDWTKKNMPTNISVTYLKGNTPSVDMATISSCDHFIATVGTYSWWSGWLTGGNVTYYRWPSKEGSPLRTVYSKDYSDYYPPHWIGI